VQNLLLTAAFIVRYGCNVGTVDQGCTDTRCYIAVVTKFCGANILGLLRIYIQVFGFLCHICGLIGLN